VTHASHLTGRGTATDTLQPMVGCNQVLDADCDGSPDELDNCPTVYNPSQENSDEAQLFDRFEPFYTTSRVRTARKRSLMSSTLARSLHSSEFDRTMSYIVVVTWDTTGR
jgi:hypothetical protein